MHTLRDLGQWPLIGLVAIVITATMMLAIGFVTQGQLDPMIKTALFDEFSLNSPSTLQALSIIVICCMFGVIASIFILFKDKSAIE